MGGVGRGDGHQIDAVGAAASRPPASRASRHRRGRRRGPASAPKARPASGRWSSAPATKAKCAVQPRAQPVRRADLAALAAADHAPVQSCHVVAPRRSRWRTDSRGSPARRPRATSSRRVAVLFDRAPAVEARVEQHLPHGGEIHVALAEVAEDALPAGVIEPGAVRDGARLHHRVDVLEMHVGNATDMAAHEGHGVEARIGMVARCRSRSSGGFRPPRPAGAPAPARSR